MQDDQGAIGTELPRGVTEKRNAIYRTWGRGAHYRTAVWCLLARVVQKDRRRDHTPRDVQALPQDRVARVGEIGGCDDGSFSSMPPGEQDG